VASVLDLAARFIAYSSLDAIVAAKFVKRRRAPYQIEAQARLEAVAAA
jgi:hypothetical protein